MSVQPYDTKVIRDINAMYFVEKYKCPYCDRQLNLYHPYIAEECKYCGAPIVIKKGEEQ